MMAVRAPTIAGLSLVCLLSTAAGSATASEIELKPSLQYFRYQEFDQADRLLNEEEGFLPGLELRYARSIGTAAIETHLGFFGGRVDYDGTTQSGRPHRTSTSTSMIDLGLQWRSRETAGLPVRVILGYHCGYWNRDIQTRSGVIGLHEIYTWNTWELGLAFESDEYRGSKYWLDISALYFFDPGVEVRLPSSRVNLAPDPGPGIRLRAGRTLVDNQVIFSSVDIFFEYRELGRSKAVFTDDFFGRSAFISEPESRTIRGGIQLGFTYVF